MEVSKVIGLPPVIHILLWDGFYYKPSSYFLVPPFQEIPIFSVFSHGSGWWSPRNSWRMWGASFAPRVRCESYACGPAQRGGLIRRGFTVDGRYLGNTGDTRVFSTQKLIVRTHNFPLLSVCPSGQITRNAESESTEKISGKRCLEEIQILENMLDMFWGNYG